MADDIPPSDFSQELACHPLDSKMYGSVFGCPKMAAIFSEKNLQQARVNTEIALLRVQSDMGVVPAGIVDRVLPFAQVDAAFLEQMTDHFECTQNDIVALVRTLQERCSEQDREFIHFGATSQDIHITGLALLLHGAVTLLNTNLLALEKTLVTLAQTHRQTLMAGRTHGGLAVPITFGYKLALWLHQFSDHQQRLQQLCPRLLKGHMKGAVGTHAAFGVPLGITMEQRIMDLLGLGWSPVNLQPSEERYAEFLSWQALVSNTVGRICQEIRNLHRSEVREVSEYFEYGVQVGSSAMPHKQNPELSETLQGMVRKVQSNAACMMGVSQEHERDATRNANEHLLIGESTIMTARLLIGVQELLETMDVNVDRMRANLELDYGLIASEPVTMALARKIGKHQTAHEIIYDCAMTTYQCQRPFLEVLLQDERVMAYLNPDEIREALNLQNYLGSIDFQIDQVIALAQAHQDT